MTVEKPAWQGAIVPSSSDLYGCRIGYYLRIVADAEGLGIAGCMGLAVK
jgi:hypothetical protein